MTHLIRCLLIAGTLAAFATPVARAALVAHYRLDETSGTVATDATGQHNAAYVGTPGLGQTGAAVGTGTSVLFDGDDAVQDALPALPGATSLSLSMWLNIDETYAGYHMAAARTDTYNDPWTVQVNPASDLGAGPGERAMRWIEGNDSGGTSIDFIVSTNQWFHLAITTTGTVEGAARVYVNGVQVGENLATPGFTDDGTQAFLIGRRGDGYPFFGGIDDFQIYSHVLTAEDTAFLYANPGQTVPDPPSTVPGDFDGDGDVDGADFVVWQTNFPTATGATLADGDADGDGDVDGADFVVWQTNFPTTPGPGVSSVPEPQSLSMLALGCMLLGGARCRRWHL